VVGDLGTGRAQELDQLLRRRLAHVVDVGLVATPSTRIFEPLTDFCAPWFRACETTERQKRGMLLFTSPASSTKRVEEYSRAFHVVEGVDRNAVTAEARARLEGQEAERFDAAASTTSQTSMPIRSHS
jgi:hypothetical protein